MTDPESGPYSRYNARRSPPAEVARGFVAPDPYWRLTDSADSQILVGPRGIGKTTLLKMLVPEGIDEWMRLQDPTSRQKRDRDRAARSIRYTGVFVAADKMWSGQVGGTLPAIAQPHRQQLGNAAFTYMSLGALAEVAEYRVESGASGFRGVHLTDGAREDVARSVVNAWHAHPATATLSSLIDQMEERLGEVGTLIQRASKPDLREEELAEITREPLLEVDFATAARRFIHGFNRAAKQPHEQWVLLVDEFEFLPPWTRYLLGQALTGYDPLLSFKLSIAPYTGSSPFEGTALNDWDWVKLTQPSRRQGDEFAHQLLSREIAKRGGTLSPEEVFGRGGFEGVRDGYEPQGRNAQDFRALAEIDPGFRQWLTHVVADSGTSALRDPARYSLVRKATPLVRLRLEYFRRGPEDRASRSRHKVPPIYAGLENLYAYAEGNPRWIKALANALLDGYDGGRRSVPRASQAQAIRNVSWDLFNNLKAVAIEPRTGFDDELGAEQNVVAVGPYEALTPFNFMESLCEFMSAGTHAARFRPDVPGMFFVDTNDSWVANVINSLVFLGALIIEQPQKGNPHEVIRPAHMWAPIFRLLPRKGKRRSLSRALTVSRSSWRPAEAARRVSRRNSHLSDGQPALFEEQR